MTDVKPPTVRLVAAALRKAGLPKGEHGGKLLNYTVTVSGWTVTDRSGPVTVAHWSRMHVGMDAAEERDALVRYTEVLRAAGWDVEEDKRSRVLRAHAPKGGGSGE